MTTTGRIQDILAQIRSTLSSKTARAPNQPGAAAARAPAARPSIEQLQAQISAGLVPLDLASAQGKRQARHVFLESVLLGEFGVNLADDPRFAEIVAGVQDSFEQHPELLADLDSLLEELRAG